MIGGRRRHLLAASRAKAGARSQLALQLLARLVALEAGLDFGGRPFGLLHRRGLYGWLLSVQLLLCPPIPIRKESFISFFWGPFESVRVRKRERAYPFPVPFSICFR